MSDARWQNVLLDRDVQKTLRYRLFGEDEKGFQKQMVHFLRPVEYVSSGSGSLYDEFNTLSMSTNGTFGTDNGDIKYWIYGNDNNTLNQSNSAYFDLPGAFSLDPDSLNDNIMRAMPGCSFSVPLGQSINYSTGRVEAGYSSGIHDIEVSLTLSHEKKDYDTTVNGDNFPRPRLVVTLWRSYKGVGLVDGNPQEVGVSDTIGGTSGNTQHWRLVDEDMGYGHKGGVVR